MESVTDVRLVTFGGLELEGSDFSEQKPLLLLCYLALGGASVRSEIAERFWGGPDKDARKVNRSLETALASLRKVDPALVTLPGRGEIGSDVGSDVRELHEALTSGDHERAMALYGGPFLPGVERSRRLKLPPGGELEEWIVDRREELRGLVQEAMLRRAEGEARLEEFSAAAELAWGAYRLDGAVTYPTPDDYRRFHTLLMAAERAHEAAEVRDQALIFADAHELGLSDTPYEARRRLTSLATLPAPAEIFVGREVEVERALARILEPRVQLVSLVGPPGVGKTELAAAVAHEARRLGHFPRGLGFVPLDGVSADAEDTALIGRLAEGLDLRLPGEVPGTRELANAIGDRETLLVLDNFEQLAPRAPLLAELIDRCPALTLLVTSRAVLKLEREHVLRIDGLSVPPEPGDDVGDYPAVALFLAAARRRGGEPRAAELPQVARIAQLVEGLPLALHLAAGWSRELSPAEIAERLEGSLQLLGSELHDVSERQRSLGSALESSLALLSGSQRALFRRLAIFHNGFDVAAAEVVTQARAAELHELANRSLLRFDPQARRHRIHPLIRRYAEEGLEEEGEGEAAALRDRHARYYLERLMEMVSEEPEVRNGAARRLRPETDNIVAAWRWGVARGWGETLVDRGHALQVFCDVTVRYPLGAELLREAEIVVKGGAADWAASLRAFRALLILRIGDFSRARTLAASSMEALGCEGISLGCWIAATVLGACSGIKGDLAGAREHFELALSYVPDRSGYAASTLVNLGLVANDLYRTSSARAYLERALDIFRALGRTSGEVEVSLHLANTLLIEGEASKARDLATVAARKARAIGNEHRHASLHRILAQAHLDLGDLQRAEASAEVHFDWAHRSAAKDHQATAFHLRGRIRHARGAYAAAREDLVRCLEVVIASGAQNMVVRFILESYDMMAASRDTSRVAQLRELLIELIDIEDLPVSERQRIEQTLSEEEGGRQPSKRAAAVPLTIREACERAIAILA